MPSGRPGRVSYVSEEHRTELGTDPATGGFRPGEAETGLRVEEQRGVTLERAPAQQGADWVGSDGKTYDNINGPRYLDQNDNDTLVSSAECTAPSRYLEALRGLSTFALFKIS